MKAFLIALFICIFGCMTAITIAATIQRGMFAAGSDLWPELWFRATLMDAYFGFITFYVWVAYKERKMLPRFAWFVAIMSLGNFAMSAYVLQQLLTIKPFSWEQLLLRRDSHPSLNS
ncbi:MAG: DUF1475 family protein [Pirellulaceae bacterium]